MTPKDVVLRFNREIIEQGSEAAYRELLPPSFVNRSAPPGSPAGPEGMRQTFEGILRPAIAGIRVEIHDQIVEGDKVTTRKTIHGTHRAALLGIPATGRAVAIDVIDIVRVENGQYAEHWGVNTLPNVLAELRAAAGPA